MADRERRQARRALRRAARQTRRAARREKRQARRADLADLLEPLVVAAERLITEGVDRGVAKLDWVVGTFFDLVDVPGIDEDEVEALVVEAVEALVARLFAR
jgi:hypothetical protein